jgi:hypothetical protein
MTKDLRKNDSGCLDPTAFHAIVNLESEDKKANELFTTILHMCRLAGFDIVGNVILEHKKTKRVWTKQKGRR